MRQLFQAEVGARRKGFSRAWYSRNQIKQEESRAKEDAVRAFGIRNVMIVHQMVDRLRELAVEGGIRI